MSGVRRIKVRCCCQPTKILGTLQLPTSMIRVGKISYRLPARRFEEVPGEIPKVEMGKLVELEIKRYMRLDGLSEKAVFSDDKPIQFWRQFPTFEEMGDEQRAKEHGNEWPALHPSGKRVPCGFQSPDSGAADTGDEGTAGITGEADRRGTG